MGWVGLCIRVEECHSIIGRLQTTTRFLKMRVWRAQCLFLIFSCRTTHTLSRSVSPPLSPCLSSRPPLGFLSVPLHFNRLLNDWPMPIQGGSADHRRLDHARHLRCSSWSTCRYRW